MEPSHSAFVLPRVAAPAGPDVGELIKSTVIEAVGLQPADFDWNRSLAEMGCDSLCVIDIQYELEKKMGVRDLGLTGSLDFNPLQAPLARLEQHVRSVLHPVGT